MLLKKINAYMQNFLIENFQLTDENGLIIYYYYLDMIFIFQSF